MMPEYSEEGLQCLAKAVKLEPKLVEAWNHLGECYWKKKDVENARNCFTGALNYVSTECKRRKLLPTGQNAIVNIQAVPIKC